MHLSNGALAALLMNLPALPAASGPSVATLPQADTPAETTTPPADEDAPPRPKTTIAFDGTEDVLARCGLLTNFKSTGEGCELGLRTGGTHVYYTGGFGFFNTPEFERRIRRGNGPIEIVNDPRSPTMYYSSAAIGFAIWPTRQIGAHLELGGFVGLIYSRAAASLPTEGQLGGAFGAFGTLGGDYRIRSFPWVFGLDYRLQSIPYAGLGGAGEKSKSSSITMESPAMGVGHFLMLSIAFRKEDDRHD
jgi:hypothetical protein